MEAMKNIFKPNSAKTTKIIRSIQGTAVTLAGTAFVMDKPVLSFILIAIGGAADILISMFDNGNGSEA